MATEIPAVPRAELARRTRGCDLAGDAGYDAGHDLDAKSLAGLSFSLEEQWGLIGHD
jgi:hypothetical protein